MKDVRSTHMRQNFEFFQEVVGGLVGEHSGEFALIRSREIVDFFSKPVDALQAGTTRFADGLFSIQKVADQPLDLGFLSYGASDWDAHTG